MLKRSTFNVNIQIQYFVRRILYIFLSMIFVVSCKKSGNAPSEIPILSDEQLVYGNSQSDRDMLQQRITGNSAPKLSDVIQRWKRFSGSTYYSDASAIVATPSNCYTTLDSNTGVWANNGGLNPNTDPSCNTASMNSLSWLYLPTTPERLFNIQNTNNYVGFFSSIKFDQYTSTANLSSADIDDDSIGLTIAIVYDGTDVYTLSAMRTQGGNSPALGWALVHKKNNTFIRVIDEKSVGGVNKNGASGDRNGWNGRFTQVKVVREGNIVKAYTSLWNTNEDALVIDESSLIQVDLSDPAQNLTMFMGPQSYGYESYSQSKASFTNLKFATPTMNADPDYLFDLKMNQVYMKKSSGIGYDLMSGVKALDMLGYPKKYKNLETQREFQVDSSTSFTEL